MSLPLPLLITGIAGVAGYNAFHYFRDKYPGQVIGIRPLVTFRLNGDGIVPLDMEDAIGVRDLFHKYRFRSVLHTLGNCALKACHVNPRMARLVNVVSASVIVENVIAHKCRLVHLSSDLVFSGTRGGNHRETDAVDPVSMYGITMAEAERLVAVNVPSAIIGRISLPMGPSFNRHAGAIDWIDSRFRNNRPATLYFDEVRSSTYCEDLNVVFERFLCTEESGIYHLGGPQPLALYEIAQIINRVGGYPSQLLKGCPRVQAGPVPPRAGNVSMNSDKLCNLLGHQPFRPWPLEPQLVPTCRDWHRHREGEEVGSMQEIQRRLYRCPVTS